MDLARITQDEEMKNRSQEKKSLRKEYDLASEYLKNKAYDEAEAIFSTLIKQEKFTVTYNCSLLSLAKIYENKKLIPQATEIYDRIIQEQQESSLFRWRAHLNRYSLTKNIDELFEIFSENPLYDWAQLELGLHAFAHDKSLAEVFGFWKNIDKESFSYFHHKYLIDLIEKIYFLNKDISNKYFQLLKNVNSLVEKLKIHQEYESLVAHYTRADIAKLILSNEYNGKGKKFKAQSLFRLGVTSLMNDPTEGYLLNELMCLDKNIQIQDLAFITCFTLHHDSLNQFRLYGKNSQQEATGLSLVLSKDFFTSEHNINLFFKSDIDPILEQKSKHKTQKKSLPNMPLYRCIYLDPTSGLIKVAQREEWSFHREYKKQNKASVLENNPEAEKNWQDYQAEILEIESKVTTHLKELVEQVELLNPQKLNDEEEELLAEILLPLRYLIKHMAFKEEQECRMIYVTQMDNPLIKYDENINRIYIDYEPSVMQHLEKIYLAPKAKGEKMVFEYLCSRGQEVRKGKAPVKVKISQNPFQ